MFLLDIMRKNIFQLLRDTKIKLIGISSSTWKANLSQLNYFDKKTRLNEQRILFVVGWNFFFRCHSRLKVKITFFWLLPIGKCQITLKIDFGGAGWFSVEETKNLPGPSKPRSRWSTLKSLIEKHARLEFSDFLSTLLAIFHVINKKFHPDRLLIYLVNK